MPGAGQIMASKRADAPKCQHPSNKNLQFDAMPSFRSSVRISSNRRVQVRRTQPSTSKNRSKTGPRASRFVAESRRSAQTGMAQRADSTPNGLQQCQSRGRSRQQRRKTSSHRRHKRSSTPLPQQHVPVDNTVFAHSKLWITGHVPIARHSPHLSVEEILMYPKRHSCEGGNLPRGTP
jgi:hypothetical protein